MVARLAGPATGLLPVVVAPMSAAGRRLSTMVSMRRRALALRVLQHAGAEAVEGGGARGGFLRDNARVAARVIDGDGGIGHGDSLRAQRRLAMSSMISSTSGKRPGGVLRGDDLAVDGPLKAAAATGDEGEAGDVVLEGGEYLAGHPLGAGQVAALGAVLKGDGKALLVHGLGL